MRFFGCSAFFVFWATLYTVCVLCGFFLIYYALSIKKILIYPHGRISEYIVMESQVTAHDVVVFISNDNVVENQKNINSILGVSGTRHDI